MTTLGAIFLPDLPPERLRAVARAADESGLDELWLWEDCFKQSGVAAAAAALAWTDRVRIGVGVFPVPLRHVALTAMEIATLDRLFPGRLVVGVGHGVQEWMAQIGAQAESPVTLLREYLSALRALLRGEQVSTDGRYVRLDAVALDWPPAPAPAILAGAVGPRTLRLSGEHADGTILTAATSPDQLRQARIHIDEGRADAARTDPHPVVVYLHTATGPEAAARLAADQIRSGKESAEDVGVAGDAHAIAGAIRRLAEAGADSVVLQPTADVTDPEGFIRFIGAEVRPLVQ
ncbi:MAG TPA: LLM class flavin-dependent oxidoreductase [Actinomycetes bacterium]|nr:LLM class flavin-dependent oxidoreductase [Actinomycetes bacterium]